VAAYIELEERYLSQARNQLGATKAQPEAEGRTLTLKQVVTYALSITLPARSK
jgi:hypothetical protein